jgi:hypothetical protein
MKNTRTRSRKKIAALALATMVFYSGTGFAVGSTLRSGSKHNNSGSAKKSPQNSNSLKSKLVKKDLGGKKFVIEATYPSFAGTAPGIANANASIAKTVTKIVSEIKLFFDGGGGCGGVYSEVIFATPNLISVKFKGSSFPEGAAHATSFPTNFNYQLSPPRELTLARLFKPGSRYLQTLSKLSRSKLLAELDNDIEEGSVEYATTPTNDHFEYFLIKKDSLNIQFEDLKYGDYRGPQDVDIPWRDLGSILAPGTAVYKLAHNK